MSHYCYYVNFLSGERIKGKLFQIMRIFVPYWLEKQGAFPIQAHLSASFDMRSSQPVLSNLWKSADFDDFSTGGNGLLGSRSWDRVKLITQYQHFGNDFGGPLSSGTANFITGKST